MYNGTFINEVISLIKKKIKFPHIIYKEIKNGAVAKSYMIHDLLIYMGKYLRIFSYIRKPFLIYNFANAPLSISLYMMKIRFFFQCLVLSWFSWFSPSFLPLALSTVSNLPFCFRSVSLSLSLLPSYGCFAVIFYPCLFALPPLILC
jgi:hypothetical protein